MNEIKLGYHYRAEPYFSAPAAQVGGVAKNLPGGVKAKPMTGKCVYIHPKGRFVTLEFPVLGGKLRECFRPEEVR